MELLKVKVAQSCPTLCNPMDCYPPGKNTGVGSCSLLQGIFLTQGLNPGLPHCSQILYHLRHPTIDIIKYHFQLHHWLLFVKNL